MGEKVRIYFTFHYVSINTDIPGLDFLKNRTLHSTMFLLIPASPDESCPEKLSLHSTIFLLIQVLSSGTLLAGFCLYIPLCFY